MLGSNVFQMKFSRVKPVSIVVATIIAMILLCAVVSASTHVVQKKQKAGAATDHKPSGEVAGAQDEPGQALAKAAEEYKSALNNLIALYDADLKKATERNAQLKDLLDKGIISRVEFEKSTAAVTEAQARVDSVSKQIVSAEADIAAAKTDWSASSDLGVPWTTGNAKIDGLIRHYSATYGVDPFLVYCVAHQESGFSASAVSPKGAQGIMQLMPDTGARYGVTNPYDTEQNIRAGVHYLKDLLQRFNGNINLALAGYNAGEGAVIRNGNTVPNISETQYYVRSIGKRYNARNSTAKVAPVKKEKASAPTKTPGMGKPTSTDGPKDSASDTTQNAGPNPSQKAAADATQKAPDAAQKAAVDGSQKTPSGSTQK